MDFELTRRILAALEKEQARYFPPGVFKHRSIQDAEALREQWAHDNFVAHQKRIALKKTT